ncbi:MAG TPA: DUF1638 domain-containing protein [Acidimicrobiia bacterium]|jgi:hypothetical protein|nr:DUF1638 domain-containing protein [Acidimicrobiia bacterium]
MPETVPPRVLVLACGALAREIIDVMRASGLDNLVLECLPASLHNRPERIPAAVHERLQSAQGRYDRVLVGYADCGTGGLLDRVVEEYGAVRLPGDHCYEFYATTAVFGALAEAEIGTFYLTDYLAKHFDRIIWAGLGLDRHPELRDAYFGNYTRLLYLSQRPTDALVAKAEAAAARLGLRFEQRHVGYGGLESALVDSAARGEQAIELAVRS